MLENETCLCRVCHSLVHEGLLRIGGEAPYGLKWFDANGTPLDKTILVETRKRFTVFLKNKKDGPCGALGLPEEKENNTIYSLDEVPDRVSAEWWQKHAHNFEAKGNRFVLKSTH